MWFLGLQFAEGTGMRGDGTGTGLGPPWRTGKLSIVLLAREAIGGSYVEKHCLV